jgi:hypothetical protein
VDGDAAGAADAAGEAVAAVRAAGGGERPPADMSAPAGASLVKYGVRVLQSSFGFHCHVMCTAVLIG